MTEQYVISKKNRPNLAFYWKCFLKILPSDIGIKSDTMYILIWGVNTFQLSYGRASEAP